VINFDRLLPHFAEIAANMRALNLPVSVIASVLGVSTRTTWRWRKQHHQFNHNINARSGKSSQLFVRRVRGFMA
jgi:hypothetical protein